MCVCVYVRSQSAALNCLWRTDMCLHIRVCVFVNKEDREERRERAENKERGRQGTREKGIGQKYQLLAAL